MYMRACILRMTWRATYMSLCCQICPTPSCVPELKQLCSRQELCFAMATKLTAAYVNIYI